MADLSQLEVRGWEVLRLASKQLVVEIVPGLGGTVTSLRRRDDDVELLFSTPWGLPHHGAVTLPGNAEAAMIDSYPGGWHTVFPNGGDTATAYGTEWGFDGEARIRWFDWRRSGSSLIMTARLSRTPFELTKIISLTGNEVTVGETVKNVGTDHVDIMWGQQVALGPALVSAGSVVDAAATLVRPDAIVARSAGYDDLLPWPRCHTAGGITNLRTLPAADRAETWMAYLSDFTDPTVSVANRDRTLRVELSWDGSAWPHLWYSLETGGRTGFPWYGAGRFLALTPNSSWPAHGVHDARRVSSTDVRIHPATARTSHLSLRVDP